DEDTYLFTIEVIRLIHLSILFRRDDFGLAYLLVVSAIEAVAQKAIKRDSVKEKHPKEKIWTEKAKQDESFHDLFMEYKASRGKNNFLSKRFIKFILKYSPPEEWNDIVKTKYDYPDEEWDVYRKGTKHPIDMTSDELEGVLNKAYNYRSRFVHSAMQPPYKYHEATMNKFFDITSNQNPDSDFELEIHPTYELLLAIAKNSLIKWMRSKCK
ncbi:TPA: hypothetical protein ACJK7B_003564, partial [Acinetobacter baumannii]